MANSVNSAFIEFMRENVNLDKSEVSKARKSRDNLIENINRFGGDEDFFDVYSEMSLIFGSFARNTKIRELDDIDLMICISAGNGRTYIRNRDCFYIFADNADINNNLVTEGTAFLDSTKVINRFISKLSKLHDYEKAEMHKNHEAATLKMRSYTWNFDIVPCFHADDDFYLIPDGKGNWKKADPRIDDERAHVVNQKHNGKVLELIRLIKFWNNRKVTIKIPSYLLECMILDIYEEKETVKNWWIDIEFISTILELSARIRQNVNDPKGIQGNLNSLSFEERMKLSLTLESVYQRARVASRLETEKKNQKAAIEKWREVLGPLFPEYTID